MTILRRSVLFASLATLILLMAANPLQNDSDKPLINQQISGLVRDIACPVQNKQSTSRHFSRDCAVACARQGSPLAILTDDGAMYLPISGGMPDTDQRPKVMPFVGKYVRVTGDVYERNGLRAIVIKKIEEDTSVKLQDDAF